MSEQSTVIVIHQCPDCTGVLTEQGILWSCTNLHPEALAAVEELAAKLGITFTGHEQAFDLDTPEGAEWRLNGTYRSVTAGITGAYADLIHYQERTSSSTRKTSL
jgi:hypothetical protein